MSGIGRSRVRDSTNRGVPLAAWCEGVLYFCGFTVTHHPLAVQQICCVATGGSDCREEPSSVRQQHDCPKITTMPDHVRLQ